MWGSSKCNTRLHQQKGQVQIKADIEHPSFVLRPDLTWNTGSRSGDPNFRGPSASWKRSRGERIRWPEVEKPKSEKNTIEEQVGNLKKRKPMGDMMATPASNI